MAVSKIHNRRQALRSTALSLTLTLVLAGSGAAQAPGATTWYRIIAASGAVLGHASREVKATPDGREIVDLQEYLLMGEDGAATRVSDRTVSQRDAAGQVASIVNEVHTGGLLARTSAKLGPGEAVITHETGADRRVTTLALPAKLRFDGGAGLLAAWDPAVTPRLEFEQLDLAGMVVERMVIEPFEEAASDLPGGTVVLRRRYVGDQLRGVVKLELDAERRIASVVQPMFGTSVTIAPADRASALKAHPPFRVIGSVVAKSPYRILEPATRGHIRYQFAFQDGLSFAPPQTGEQKVRLEPGGAVVDICADCGPGLASDPASLAQALKPTPWLQSDHRRLKAIAGPVARMKVTDARKMEMLSVRARTALKRIDFTGHFSALDALALGAGDCTEAAALLAALGRAAGVPTKVVNGLVYSRGFYHGFSNVFIPHSWVAAYVDGEWRSYDAALGAFDSTHVALTIGDGDQRSLVAAGQLGSLLRWESLAEVRPRPAV